MIEKQQKMDDVSHGNPLMVLISNEFYGGSLDFIIDLIVF